MGFPGGTVNLGYNELYIPLEGFVKNKYSLRPDGAKPERVYIY